ncbi:MAG: protein kinase [Planctomycetes bacterium]|nr:protein kinase [Planctomycetota bacterium]
MNHPQPNSSPSSVPEASAVSSNDSTNPVSVTPHQEPAESPRFSPATNAGEIGRLGRYRIQKELGRGGMGAVYLAFDERLQRKVALKVMLPKAAANMSAKERFLREARAAARISSDYVVNIHEADEFDGIPYISLQYLQGYPLDDYLSKHGNPSIPQIIRIGQEAALGLHAAHQLGLIHRDIKPANLWLEAPNGRVKILDFGLARQLDDNVQLTRSGAVVGTPAFMSPEQGRGLPMDGRSDLFSLGGVLYRLCAGRLPFHGDTTMALLMSIGIDEPVLVRDFNPDVPKPLANLIHRLLAKDPAHRPPTAQAVADELNAMANLSAGLPPGGQPQIVYVPMTITAVEANPFADITDGNASNASSESLPSTQLEFVPEKAQKPFPKLLVGSLVFALLVVIGAAFLLMNNPKKPDTEIADKLPDVTPTPPVIPPKVTPTKDTERAAANYVLDIGGQVKVNGQPEMCDNPAQLPKERFRLTGVYLLTNRLVDDQGLAKLKECRSLNALRLSDTKVTDQGLMNLKDCTALTYLDLSFTRANLTSAGVVNFKDCKCLEYLDLSETQVDDTAVEIISGMRVLTSLYVPKTRISPEGVKKLAAALPRCKILHDGGEIKPMLDPERRIAEYVISIGGTVKLNDQDSPYKATADLPKEPFRVTVVNLDGSKQVTDVGLAIIKDCQALKELHLAQTPITDVGLAFFEGCTTLTLLDLHETNTGDAGMANFSKCNNFSRLFLSSTKIGDKTLKQLLNTTALAELDLATTQVTPAGVKLVRERFPKANIYGAPAEIEPKK